MCAKQETLFQQLKLQIRAEIISLSTNEVDSYNLSWVFYLFHK